MGIPAGFDIGDSGSRRALFAPGDEFFKRRARSFGHALHRTVGAVSYPASQAEFLGALHRRSAEIDALDAPVDLEMNAGEVSCRFHRFFF